MVNEIKPFEERVNELVELGKTQGFITYEQIAKKTIDLELDNNALDELYNIFSENNITVVAEGEEGESGDIKVKEEEVIEEIADVAVKELGSSDLFDSKFNLIVEFLNRIKLVYE